MFFASRPASRRTVRFNPWSDGHCLEDRISLSDISNVGVGNIANNGDANTRGENAVGGNTVNNVNNSGDFKHIHVRQ